MAFVELLARSNFSFLRGASQPEEVVLRAVQLGLTGLALCDRDGLYGAARAYQQFKELRQKDEQQKLLGPRGVSTRLIVGAELSVNPGLPRTLLAKELEKRPSAAHPKPGKKKAKQRAGPATRLEVSSKQEAKARASPHELPTVYCLVENRQGYSNLCQLLTSSHGDMPKGEGVVEVDWLLEHAEGLRLVVPVPEQPALLFPLLSSALGVKRPSVHIESTLLSSPTLHWAELERLAGGFEGRLAIAAVRRLDGYDPQRNQLAERWGSALGVPIVASNRPRYHLPSRKALADVLHCVRLGTSLDRAGTQLLVNTEASLRSEAEMRELFADHPEWVEASARFAEPLRFGMGELDYQFPCQLADGESADGRLERLTWEGAERRYPEGTPGAVVEQIRKELKLIERLGVAPYFLSTWEVVELARARRILCQGRGSAANSAVCYVLGITAVDPARSKLLFERFLSEERAEPPDIDIDFEHERREEVIQDIYERYGRDRAAMVSEVICYRGKSALREVGKAFGLSLEQVDRLSSAITHWDTAEVSDRRLTEYGFDVGDPRLRQVVMLARALEGFPRHLSIHVGGFVLSATPLHHVAPVEPARMPGRTVVPWDKDDMEALGFFKIDVLGLGMLTAVRKALELIEQDGALPALPSVDPRAPRPGVGKPWKACASKEPATEERAEQQAAFDPLEAITHIPPEDPQVYAMVSRADTVGVFQIESRAQMAMLPRLRPECFYDLVIEVALVRPGPIQGGMVHPYLRRRNGEEPVTAPHPSLWPILERTLGVPLFQEQVMQISIVGAGYSGGEADQLRRDMAAWKKTGRLMRHRDRLLQGFARQGISRQFGEALFEQIKGFGDYGFPESHAASFALIVYSSAWEKAYFPAHFACALLNSQPMGFYSPSSIVRDAQAHGVLVRDVSVMHSAWDSSLEWATEAEANEQPPAANAQGAQRIPRQIPGYGAWLSPPNPNSEADLAAPRRPEACARRRRVLRLGLRLVKGMGEETAQRIVAARQEKAFESLHDLVLRAKLKKDEVEALAEAGALEALVGGRRQALWKARAPRSGELFEPVELQEAAVELPALRAPEQLLLDYGRKGLSVVDHPMCHVRSTLKARGVLSSEQLQDVAHGARVKVAGVVLSRQQPGTASGVVFITLEDEVGIMNLVLYSKVFDQFRLIARHSTLLLAHGKIERQITPPKATSLAASQSVPIIHVVVSEVERLDRPGGFVVASRDFH